MATILGFKPPRHGYRHRANRGRDRPCEIVIFPGTRIERQKVDLSYRLRDTAGRDDFKDIGGKSRTRRTS